MPGVELDRGEVLRKAAEKDEDNRQEDFEDEARRAGAHVAPPAARAAARTQQEVLAQNGARLYPRRAPARGGRAEAPCARCRSSERVIRAFLRLVPRRLGQQPLARRRCRHARRRAGRQLAQRHLAPAQRPPHHRASGGERNLCRARALSHPHSARARACVWCVGRAKWGRGWGVGGGEDTRGQGLRCECAPHVNHGPRGRSRFDGGSEAGDRGGRRVVCVCVWREGRGQGKAGGKGRVRAAA